MPPTSSRHSSGYLGSTASSRARQVPSHAELRAHDRAHAAAVAEYLAAEDRAARSWNAPPSPTPTSSSGIGGRPAVVLPATTVARVARTAIVKPGFRNSTASAAPGRSGPAAAEAGLAIAGGSVALASLHHTDPPTANEAADDERARQEERLRLHQKSRAWVATWNGTLLGQRQASLAARAHRLAAEESQRQAADAAWAAEEQARRDAALHRARALQAVATEPARELASAQLLAAVLDERERQIAYKKEVTALRTKRDAEDPAGAVLPLPSTRNAPAVEDKKATARQTAQWLQEKRAAVERDREAARAAEVRDRQLVQQQVEADARARETSRKAAIAAQRAALDAQVAERKKVEADLADAARDRDKNSHMWRHHKAYLGSRIHQVETNRRAARAAVATTLGAQCSERDMQAEKVWEAAERRAQEMREAEEAAKVARESKVKVERKDELQAFFEAHNRQQEIARQERLAAKAEERRVMLADAEAARAAKVREEQARRDARASLASTHRVQRGQRATHAVEERATTRREARESVPNPVQTLRDSQILNLIESYYAKQLPPDSPAGLTALQVEDLSAATPTGGRSRPGSGDVKAGRRSVVPRPASGSIAASRATSRPASSDVTKARALGSAIGPTQYMRQKTVIGALASKIGKEYALTNSKLLFEEGTNARLWLLRTATDYLAAAAEPDRALVYATGITSNRFGGEKHVEATEHARNMSDTKGAKKTRAKAKPNEDEDEDHGEDDDGDPPRDDAATRERQDHMHVPVGRKRKPEHATHEPAKRARVALAELDPVPLPPVTNPPLSGPFSNHLLETYTSAPIDDLATFQHLTYATAAIKMHGKYAIGAQWALTLAGMCSDNDVPLLRPWHLGQRNPCAAAIPGWRSS
ncbi:hypothetical protein GGF32_007121 [Allomyces javanicus]|nr:hypothetical protein GGF32_007121 [Allomyces javanicus]